MTAPTPRSWRSFGWALLTISLGIFMFVIGIHGTAATEPSCGGSAMEQDELCRHWDPDLGYDSGYDVDADDELRSERTFGWVGIIFGAGLLLGTGIALWRWSERGELPWQSPRTPITPPARSGPVPPRATPAAPRPAMQNPMRPIVLQRQNRGIMLAAGQDGIRVQRRPPHSQESTPWRTTMRLRWIQIETLEFDVDRYDSPIALYAVLRGAGRDHVIDAQRFSRSEWERFASGIPTLSGGTVSLDLTRLDNPGPDRFN